MEFLNSDQSKGEDRPLKFLSLSPKALKFEVNDAAPLPLDNLFVSFKDYEFDTIEEANKAINSIVV